MMYFIGNSGSEKLSKSENAGKIMSKNHVSHLPMPKCWPVSLRHSIWSPTRGSCGSGTGPNPEL